MRTITNITNKKRQIKKTFLYLFGEEKNKNKKKNSSNTKGRYVSLNNRAVHFNKFGQKKRQKQKQ